MVHPPDGRLPDFIVIGSMKAATTTLHAMLDRHPDIFMSQLKELCFFVEEKNWSRGEPWYRRQFVSDARLCGESSPSYTKWPTLTGVPERMHRMVPNAKLVFTVRDPVARVVSHYHHRIATGRETRPIDDAIRDPHYLRRSRYYEQLLRYLEAGFELERVLILEAEQLRHDRSAVLARTFAFLGVDTEPAATIEDSDRNVADQKLLLNATGRRVDAFIRPVLAPLPGSVRWWTRRTVVKPFAKSLEQRPPRPETVDQVRRSLADDAERFRTLTGRTFARWTV